VSRADAPVFFDSDAIEWQAHPLFPPIDIKDLQPGAAHPAGAFSLMRVRVAAGGRIDPHTHPVETETAYVLRGSARLLCQGAATELRTGGGVSIPPGLEHSLEADSEVELLAIHTPPLR
jgi:quercetin dioxygenase-like cupin family protein